MSTHRGRRAGFVALMAAAGLALTACTDDYVDPYLDAPDMRPAAEVLEDLNLASIGLRAYECDLFEAELARCYEAPTWGSVRSGRETVAHLHRELLDAGARFYGGSDHSRAEDAPEVAGLGLGCYFDYATADAALRVAVVGPSGEGTPCQNGLPAEGVSEVWIIAAPFDAVLTYDRVEYPRGLETLLQTLPRVVAPDDDVYGGPASTVEGYYGPELPARGEGTGVVVLTETVSVKDGVARGLVQYLGDGSEPGTGGATGVWGVIVTAGDKFTTVPIVIRTGESAPFEMKVGRGTKPRDLGILQVWEEVGDDWRGGLLLDGPAAVKNCAEGATRDDGAVKALKPGKKEKCWVVEAETTTFAGDEYVLDALIATFNPNGTVKDVFEPFVVPGAGGETGLVRLVSADPHVTVAWVTRVFSADRAGVWMRYAKTSELANSAAYEAEAAAVTGEAGGGTGG